MNYDWLGFFLVLLFGFLLTVGPLSKFLPKILAGLLLTGFFVRVIGTLVRYWVIYGYYDGGDAGRYYRYGLVYADFIRSFDFSFLESAYFRAGHFWGTQATITISGFVLSVIGPSIKGEFLVFSMFAFVGLVFVCLAYQKNFPHLDPRKYMKWVIFCPSLWFWSGSVGKEALILTGTCIAIYGYSSHSKKIRWVSMIVGLVITALIRPHVAGVLVVSITIAHWLSPASRWTLVQWFQGIAILILAVFVLRHGFAELGMEEIDVENIKGFVGFVGERSTQGGSAITPGGFSITGIPMAFINVLFRPFPWEIGNPMMAASAAEVLLFWTVIFWRWRRVSAVLKRFRHSRLLRVALPFIVLYTLMLGMAIGNMGILVRQRIHIIPLLLVWLEAIPLKQFVARANIPGRTQVSVLARRGETGIVPEPLPRQE